MSDRTGNPCIDTLGIPCGSKISIAIVFIVASESRNSAMLCSSIAPSITLRDASGGKVDNHLPLFCCP